MAELMIFFVVILAFGIWEVLKLIWRLIVWATQPIRDEMAFHRVVEAEMQKKQRIIKAHRAAVREIDKAVAFYLDRHEQALAQSDDEPGRRQSGPSSEDRSPAAHEIEQSTPEPLQVVVPAPEGYYWSWRLHPVSGCITVRAGRREIAPVKRPQVCA